MAALMNFMLFCPLFSAALILLFMRKRPLGAQVVSVASAAACLAALLYALFGAENGAVAPFSHGAQLFKLGDFAFDFGLMFDSLSANMIFVVCFVGFLIHIFSVGYMDHDDAKPRFFGGLSFFMFSMTGIVFSSNLLEMFVFWEFVGFSSYMLIAHYSANEDARAASKKAFITNRVGDFGFLLGIIWCWHSLGTVDFAEIKSLLAADPAKASTAMGLLVMCGFLGKSAQIPLQVWLTDAMAGPTPVSALIHAATMVAAGVFMMCRLGQIGFLTPGVLGTALVLCSLLAFLAGLWALGQTDIKKTLAYSTLAHLGLMGAAVGMGLFGIAMFHLTMHAFFKAGLFLVAGSVIHACSHEQDMFKLGGLFKKMPVTAVAALIFSLSIISVPYFAGFYSKDAILNCAFAENVSRGDVLSLAALVLIGGAAFLTPVYMGRFFFNIFLGSPQSGKASAAKESSAWMTLPLVVLAVFALGGAWGVAYGLKWSDGLMSGLLPSAATELISAAYAGKLEALKNVDGMHTFEMATLCMTLLALLISWGVYGRNKGVDPVAKRMPVLFGALKAHGWFDDIYDYYVGKIQQRFAALLSVLDLLLLHNVLVRGTAAVAAVFGEAVKRLHAARAYSYTRWIMVGIVVIFIILIA